MRQEALQAPEAVALQLEHDANAYRELGALLRLQPPSAVLTVARGSSDHAAHYLAYLIMARMGRLVTSLPMSLVTLYQSQIPCAGLLSLAFSQSGQSPDLVAPTEFFRAGGALTAAFVNDANSPLAQAARYVFPLHAGAERSVAATKSFIAQMVAGARLVAAWRDETATNATAASAHAAFQDGIANLPQALALAALADWSPAIDTLKHVDKLLVIGRGLGLPVAMEAALKFKETCGIQAEAFSGAEVKHGPMALVEEGYPMLVFAPPGPAQAGLLALAQDMRRRGANVLLAAPPGTPDAQLHLSPSPSVDLAPICMVQSFYPMVEALARARGLNPDSPRHLAKVTRTR